MLPTHYCPTCAAPALRHLDTVSVDAQVDYYRCDDCARCFILPKAAPSHVSLTEITYVPTTDSGSRLSVRPSVLRVGEWAGPHH